MHRSLQKELKQLNKRESKLLSETKQSNTVKDRINEKIPEGLQHTLELAFTKAFKLIFIKGTGTIEKTFHKEDILLEFEANEYILDRKTTGKNIKRLDKQSQKSNLVNTAITTASGMGLGLLGIGIPDIPLLVGTILKGLYQTALSYGFSYETTQERVYMLRLIRVALCSDERKAFYNTQLDAKCSAGITFEEEIVLTAQVLSDELLVEKFIQGIPIVGIIGAVTNNLVYQKIARLSAVKYKKRHLLQKIGAITQANSN